MSKFIPASRVSKDWDRQQMIKEQKGKIQEMAWWPDPEKGPYLVNPRTAKWLNESFGTERFAKRDDNISETKN